MKIFAISDLHLSTNNPKPMDIFGDAWGNYWEKIVESWTALVADEDVVLISGDFSWAMKLEGALLDFDILKTLPGKKVLIRGNHDYWWQSISTLRKSLPDNVYCLQNDSIKMGKYIICGSRGWNYPIGSYDNENDKRLYERETLRLGLSLQNANKSRLDGDVLICMLHYPPFTNNVKDTPVTQLLEANGVETVVYGHLHHKTLPLLTSINDINYYLTTCSVIGNKLIQIY